ESCALGCEKINLRQRTVDLSSVGKSSGLCRFCQKNIQLCSNGGGIIFSIVGINSGNGEHPFLVLGFVVNEAVHRCPCPKVIGQIDVKTVAGFDTVAIADLRKCEHLAK